MIQSAEYKYSQLSGQKICVEVIYTDGKVWSVPMDEENRHYVELLEWVALGNTITDNGGGE
jgi:hypothetical protein